MFKKVDDAINWIENIKRGGGRRQDLSRMKLALNHLNNPQNAYKKIHITGTNGKGSTLNYLRTILMTNNLKVGAFISPYIISFNERIQVNNDYISDNDLIKYANKINELQNTIFTPLDEVLTFFEVITLIMFLHFEEQKIDIALIEVGIGGLLDATNVIDSNLCLITNIGYDHQKVLGATLEEIAVNKLGIVKENNHLITTVDKKLYELFNNHCNNVNATVKFINTKSLTGTYLDNKMHFMYETNRYSLSMYGDHQVVNAILAIEAAKYLIPNINLSDIFLPLSKCIWPGRFEYISSNPTYILDGAHNIDGINTLSKTIQTLYPQKVRIIFCALGDKDITSMLKKLEKVAFQVILTHVPDDKRSINAIEMYNLCKHPNKIAIDKFEDLKQFLDECTSIEDINIFTGSLHFISYIRKKFLDLK